MNILTKFKDLTIESLKDNKKLIIGLYLLFIITFIVAWLMSSDIMSNLVSNNVLTQNISNTLGDSQVSAIFLFTHNVFSAIVTYVASIFFGFPAIILLLYNAMNLGFVGQLLDTAVPGAGIRYIVYLIPHGIFEITATVLQSVAGLLLFYFIYKFIKTVRSGQTGGVGDAYQQNKKILIQSIVILVFSMILLVIAAPIEAYISIPFADLIVGLL